MNELKPCRFCGAPAHKWSWNGGTRIDCSAWDSSDKHTHYVGIGAKTGVSADVKCRMEEEEHYRAVL